MVRWREHAPAPIFRPKAIDKAVWTGSDSASAAVHAQGARNADALQIAERLVLAVTGFLRDQAAGDVQRRPDAKSVVATVKARDAALDNAALRFFRTQAVEIRPPSFSQIEVCRQFGLRVGPVKRRSVSCRWDERLVVRGPYATFTRQLIEPPPRQPIFRGNVYAMFFSPGAKSSNTDDLIRCIDRMSDGSHTTSIRRRSTPVDRAQEIAMMVRFALGFGYAKHIKDVMACRFDRDGGVDVIGTIQVWQNDDSVFRMKLDGDYVVRNAVIDCNVGGSLTRFTAETHGTVRAAGGVVFAKSGRLVRTWVGRLRHGIIVGPPRVRTDFTIEYADLKLGLSDKEYDELTNMSPPPGTQIMDRRAPRAGAASRNPSKFDVRSRQRQFSKKQLIKIRAAVLIISGFAFVAFRKRQRVRP